MIQFLRMNIFVEMPHLVTGTTRPSLQVRFTEVEIFRFLFFFLHFYILFPKHCDIIKLAKGIRCHTVPLSKFRYDR